jgi:PadR family transcriptional regulator PadR
MSTLLSKVPDMDQDEHLAQWTVQVRKGLLEVLVLNALQGGETYAYDLVRSLGDAPGVELAEGTLYPLLSRLRLQGLVATRLVESNSGPARKYYRLTPAGERALAAMNAHLDALVAACRRRWPPRSEP